MAGQLSLIIGNDLIVDCTVLAYMVHRQGRPRQNGPPGKTGHRRRHNNYMTTVIFSKPQ